MRTFLAEIWLDSFFLCELIIEHARILIPCSFSGRKVASFCAEEQLFQEIIFLTSLFDVDQIRNVAFKPASSLLIL